MTSMRKKEKSERGLSNPCYEDWRPFRTFRDLELPEVPESTLSAALESLEVNHAKAIAQLRERLKIVIRDYWVEHRAVVERPPAKWYRSKVEAIRKATDHLLLLVREPTGTGLAQLRIEISRSLGRGLRGGGPESIERILEDLSAASRRCRYSTKRGAIPHTHLRRTVAELTEIWTEYSNRPFTRNFKTADNRRYKNGRPIAVTGHADAFLAPGPRFIQVMMQHIDPGVPLSLIRTALRSSAAKPRS